MRFAQLFGLLMTTLWASLATAGTVTTSVYAPLTGTVNVTTEVVEVTGFVHVVTRCIPTDPCAIYVNLVRVEGEGQTTGQRYLGLGTASVELVELPPNPIVPLALTFALLPVGSPGVPPNPIQPIEAMRVTLTLEFDPTGVLVAVSALASSAPPPGGE